MTYAELKKRMVEVKDAPPINHACPAYGCPNAASVSFDNGGHWACYYHAKAEPSDWPATTTFVREGWPATCNWNHPDKLAYERGQGAARLSKMPAHTGPVGLAGMAEILGDVR
jgi:hypothetical protein